VLVRYFCLWIQFILGRVVSLLCVRFCKKKWPSWYLVAALLSMISQSKWQCEWPSYFCLWHRALPPNFWCFDSLDAGPYRLEGEGVTSELILPLGLMDGGKSQRVQAGRGWWAMNALEFWDAAATIAILSFREPASPPEPLTSETSLSRT
jgi:hypothetical protein